MVILNINGVNAAIKRHRLSGWIKAGYRAGDVAQLIVEYLSGINRTKIC